MARMIPGADVPRKSALMKPLHSRAVEQQTLSSPLRMAIRRSSGGESDPGRMQA
jgi:hypothetical protein